jgi:uncharacterized protein
VVRFLTRSWFSQGLLCACLLVSAGSAVAEELPQVDQECINDHGKLLGKADRAKIRSLCKKAQDDGVQMVVVTVRSLGEFKPLNLDQFVDDVFDEWDIEYDAANHAIMLFVARKERQIRIRMGEAYPEKAWKTAKNVMRRTVGPSLGRGASGGIRRGFARLYTEVAKPHIRTRKREEEAAKRKRGVVNFE